MIANTMLIYTLKELNKLWRNVNKLTWTASLMVLWTSWSCILWPVPRFQLLEVNVFIVDSEREQCLLCLSCLCSYSFSRSSGDSHTDCILAGEHSVQHTRLVPSLDLPSCGIEAQAAIPFLCLRSFQVVFHTLNTCSFCLFSSSQLDSS